MTMTSQPPSSQSWCASRCASAVTNRWFVWSSVRARIPRLRRRCEGRFQLSPEDVYDMPRRWITRRYLRSPTCLFPGLRDNAWIPLTPPAFRDEAEPDAIFAAIRRGDVLVHHPYESFDASVEHFISAAADDPQTISIKMTAYRIGDDTPFVKSLIRAAERGKQVACVMEIKARFDEERNLHWAGELERVGAHVTFGVRGLKTHAKTALVVRKEHDGLRCYAHIGTGNYHVKTARLYADFGLLTSNPALTKDVVNLFHFLTGHSHMPDCATILVAPSTMRTRMLELIHREVENVRLGRPARVIAKMNQLEDPDMIEALCEASNAGVPIDLIVRGFCCLRPGVEGPNGEHSNPFDHRALPRTLTYLPLCQRQRESGGWRVLYWFRGLDVPESIEARGGGHARVRLCRPREALGMPRYVPPRSEASMDSWFGRVLVAIAARRGTGRAQRRSALTVS